MGQAYYGKQLYVKEDITEGLKKFFNKIDPKARGKGLVALGLQLINNTVQGSPRESVRAPIWKGRLRGSGSVFVGSKKVGDTLFLGESGTLAQAHAENNFNVVTVGFNTEYAARVHERLKPAGDWIPGGKSGKGASISADVGGKFLERHLKADKTELYQLYTDIYRKAAGT